MPLPSEDARIVQTRSLLELYWREELSDGDRADWRARWLTRPPFDVYGRTYVPRVPITMQEVEVTEKTAYAWSQIYAVLRYNVAPVNSPTMTGGLNLGLLWTISTTTSQQFHLQTDADPVASLPVLLWMSAPMYATRGTPIWLLRPVAAYTAAASPNDFDATADYTRRFTPTAARQVVARVATINANNELDGLSNLAAAVLT